jgi:hypothetical protein
MTPEELAVLEEMMLEEQAVNRSDLTPEAIRSMALQKMVIKFVQEYIAGFPDPYLTMDDGSVVTLSTDPDDSVLYRSSCDAHSGYYSFRTAYIDVARLRSITFCGVEYLFE